VSDKKTILIIEDNEDVLQAMMEDLQAALPDVSVKTATNRSAAFEAVKDTSIAAIITDNSLPETSESRKDTESALRICEEARKYNSSVPLYVFSAGIDEAHRGILTRMGAFVSTGKSFDEFDEIINALRKLLSKPSHLPDDHRQPGTKSSSEGTQLG